MDYKTLAISIFQHLEHEYKSTSSTRLFKRAYIAQVVPRLMMTMTLGHGFDIPGEGQIQNVDKSMCYVFNSAKMFWTV